MNESLGAVVLAGVHDWGACLLNQAVVRPLAPIANRPVVEYVLRALRDTGVNHTMICANGQGPRMRRAVREMAVGDMDISFLEDGMPRGPAGCVKDAVANLDSGVGELIVIEASVIPYFDIDELLRSHRSTGACLTIATRQGSAAGEHVESAVRTGSAGDGSDGSHSGPYRPVGVYVFSPQVMAHIGDVGFQDIKEGVVPKLYAAGLPVGIHPIDGAAPRLFGIGSYFALNEWALKLMLKGAWELEGYVRKGSALVHVDSQVDETVRFLGPVMVGPGSILRDKAIIVGPTSIGGGCIVGQEAVVSRSALWADAVVGSGAQVDRSIVASQARVETDSSHFNTVCLPTAAAKKRSSRRVSRQSDQKSTEPFIARLRTLGTPRMPFAGIR